MRKIKIMENTFCTEAAKRLTPSKSLNKQQQKKTSAQNLAVCTWKRKHGNRIFFLTIHTTFAVHLDSANLNWNYGPQFK